MNTIVVPTDCSDLSRRALRYADRFASVSGATIVAVYGATFSARLEGEGIAASLASREDLQSMMMPARRCVEEAAAQELSPETKHRIVIADCLPADAVIDVANARNADLIVMGTRDRNRLTRAVLGSVTDAVLHLSNRPVLIVREQSDDRALRTILCPFRDTPDSLAAIRQAGALRRLFDAKLVLARVVEENEAGTRMPEPLAAALTDCGDCEVHEFRRNPDPGPRMVKLAEETKADLIVIGTQHRRFSDPSVIGTPASIVVRMAKCPVLSVTASASAA
jgi:nucleotide-binding universal stress UspA family protein